VKITVVGTGYVGLVTGTCLSETGNDVICADINEKKITDLNNSIIPIYEPGLEELIRRNKKEGRLSFSTNVKESIEKSLIIFISVDTPSQEDGSPNMTRVEKVAQDIGQYINSYKIIVNKSTVPVGTGEIVREIIKNEIKKRNLEE
jgi:UDPglucose 6-dehydrogenase